MLLSEEERDSLCLYVVAQLNNFLPDKELVSSKLIASAIPQTLERVEYCFSHIADRYFFDNKKVLFNHLHGDQYGMFLYYLSNTLYRRGEDISVCAKLFALNKILHGVDAFYEVELPNVFRWVHPLGTVLGRGVYGDFFLVYQRCGIGSNRDVYPTMGKFFSMHPGSSVLGSCYVGDFCEMGAESLLLDRSLSEKTLYLGMPGNFKMIQRDPDLSCWRNC